MYALSVKPLVSKIFLKLAKKDKVVMGKVTYKIEYIQRNPHKRYKFLKGELKSLNRVHVADHFVLIFSLDHSRQMMTIIHFAHHDDAYE